MVDVQPADVSVAGPAEIVSLHVMVGDCADRRWPRNETILVVMSAGVIEIGQKAQLARITFPNQILSENVSYVNLLFAPTELIQVRVSVLFEHIEGSDVVLPAVVVVIAENTNAEVGIIENEAAKIAHERLDARPHRNEIISVR